MNARINQAVIEGLATMGLGHKVPFLWEPCPLDAVHSANCVEFQALIFPQLEDSADEGRLNAGIGLALLGVQAHGGTQFQCWPKAGLRREAMATLELGVASIAVLAKMPHAVDKLLALHGHLLSQVDPEAEESRRFLQCMLMSSLEIGMGLDSTEFWSSQPPGERALNSYLRQHLAQDHSTEKLAELVTVLVAEEAPPAMPQGESKGPEDSPQQQAQPDPAESAEQEGQGGTGDTLGGGQTGSPENGEEAVGSESSSSADTAGSAAATPAEAQPGNGGAKDGSSESAAGSSQQQPYGDEQETREPGQPGDALAESTTGEQAQAQPIGEDKADLADAAQAETKEHEPVEKVKSQGVSDEPVDSTSQVVMVEALFGLEGGDGFAARMPVSKSETLPGADGRLVSALLMALQAKRKRNVGLANAGPRVVASRLWRLRAVGDTMVFRKPEQRDGMDMAVEVLLDRSSSMDKGNRMTVARDVTMSLATALNRMTGVSSAIDVFPGYGSAATSILPFGGMLNMARSEMQGVFASGGTPLADALTIVRPVLLQQRKRRKVLLVITDGKPHTPTLAMHQLQICREMGIEVYAIGIGVNVEDLIPASTMVEAVDELPRAVTKIFTNMLEAATA